MVTVDADGIQVCWLMASAPLTPSAEAKTRQMLACKLCELNTNTKLEGTMVDYALIPSLEKPFLLKCLIRLSYRGACLVGLFSLPIEDVRQGQVQQPVVLQSLGHGTAQKLEVAQHLAVCQQVCGQGRREQPLGRRHKLLQLAI